MDLGKSVNEKLLNNITIEVFNKIYYMLGNGNAFGMDYFISLEFDEGIEWI